MYELVQVAGNSYYIQSPAKIGLVQGSTEYGGLPESTAAMIRKQGARSGQLLEANGWRLTAIYNTHSNADHIGGNKYLRGRPDVPSTPRASSAAFTRAPYFGSSLSLWAAIL